MWVEDKRITNAWKYMQRGLAENGSDDGQPKARREGVHLLPLSASSEFKLKENWRTCCFSWVNSFERHTLVWTQSRQRLFRQTGCIRKSKMATPQTSEEGWRDCVSTRNREQEIRAERRWLKSVTSMALDQQNETLFNTSASLPVFWKCIGLVKMLKQLK